MKQRNRILVAALSTLLTAILLGGCGSGNKDGGSQSGNPLFGGVATVGDTACVQCHSSVTESLTGETLVSQYQSSSPHNVSGLGCESCHGGGAGHNGVGPIPYPLVGLTPNQIGSRCVTCHDGVQTLTVNGVATTPRATNSNSFESSNHATGTPSHTSGLCVRCHTHEGAVLSDASGFTGDGPVISNASYGPPVWGGGFTGFKCETCHQHGGGLRIVKGRDAATGGNIVLWDPNANRRTDQFDLCTSCHTMYNYNGTQLLVDGNTYNGVTTGVVGEHDTSWYRIIASTHFDNPNTGVGLASTLIEGYNLRRTGENPCFDCHGHEAKTETRNASRNPPTDSTIHTDWAKSAHAGKLLQQKIDAIGANTGAAAVAAAMGAGVSGTSGAGWEHYNWDDTSSRGSCQMCHTSTGISNYLTTQNTALTGYASDGSGNSFSHLSGWSATGGSPQNELLYCWGCHSNAGTGAMRNTSQAIFSFADPSGNAIVVSDAGKSTACVVCHGGRGSAGAAITNDSARSSRFAGHHAPTAGVLFSAKTHIGFEYPGQNYANPSFFAHDKIGANGDGPCASCHMGPSPVYGKASHTFAAVTEGPSGITAINNQTLCNTCHTPGGQFEITPAKLEEESDGYTQASTILNNYVSNVAGYTNYLNRAITSSNYNDTTLVPTNAYGAYQNGKLNGDEPCAYVHNRFYVKRLIFDSIDWMDNGALNGTISIDATTYPSAAAWFGAPTGTTGTFTASRP
jgi:hypothetical protein